jgi:hypothetical protein
MSAKHRTSKEVYVFDAGVADLQELLAAVGTGQRIVILDSGSDGVLQLADALAGESELDAIHLFSHGAVGSLLLGSTLLDQANLSGYSEALAQIGNALTDSGDFLLYGCNVAQGDSGLAFIEQLAQATGADVAASTDLTGSNDRSGNWLLEFSKGNIDIAPIQAANQGGKKHTERSLFEKGGLAQAARWRMMSARCGPWPAKIIRSWRQNPKDTPSLRQVCFRLATVSRHGRPGSLPIGSSLPRCQTR